jgi:hypothetical protein
MRFRKVNLQTGSLQQSIADAEQRYLEEISLLTAQMSLLTRDMGTEFSQLMQEIARNDVKNKADSAFVEDASSVETTEISEGKYKLVTTRKVLKKLKEARISEEEKTE